MVRFGRGVMWRYGGDGVGRFWDAERRTDDQPILIQPLIFHSVFPRDSQRALDPPARALLAELHLHDRLVHRQPRDLARQVVELPRRYLVLSRLDTMLFAPYTSIAEARG